LKTTPFSIEKVWTSRKAAYERSCGLKSSLPGGYAFMTLNVVGNSLEKVSRYCRFMSDAGDRFAAGFAARFAEGFACFERALTPSRPWRMTGFLFAAAFAVFRAAGRFVFFISASCFSTRVRPASLRHRRPA
jgi:hypothetical protein